MLVTACWRSRRDAEAALKPVVGGVRQPGGPVRVGQAESGSKTDVSQRPLLDGHAQQLKRVNAKNLGHREQLPGVWVLDPALPLAAPLTPGGTDCRS
jgi:hypothetical protein